MKNVFLYAYDKTNLGDDLFIETIVNRYPNVRFYMISDLENKRKFSRLRNLKIIDRNSKLINTLHKIRPSLAVRYETLYKKKTIANVYIGGSIFMEYPTWKNIVNWWKYQAEHYNFYVLGANFGPYKTEEYKDEMKKVFLKLKDVCFRDRYSYELFSDIESVRYAPDILFGYDKMPKATQIKKQVFMSLIDCNSKEDDKLKHNSEQYILKMAELADFYLKDGYKIVFVSFCNVENDMKAIKDVCSNIPQWKENIDYSVMEYDGYNTQQILLEMAESEYIIASRFHAVILGMLAERPVLPVIYSDKTKYVLENMEFRGNYIDIRHIDLCSSINDMIQNEVVDINKLINDANIHFSKLDNILK